MHADTHRQAETQARPPEGTGPGEMARRPDPGTCVDCQGQTQAQGFYSALDKGWRWLPAPNLCPACERNRQLREQEQDQRAEARSVLAKANLPPKLMAWDFGQAWDAAQAYKGGGDLDAYQRAWQACKSWHGGKTGLLLRGPAGTGKSALLVCTVKAWVEFKQASAFYLNVADLNAEIAARGARRTAARELLPRAREAGLAAVDDLAVERMVAETQRELVSLINARQSAGRPTLIATNASAAQLAARFKRGDPHGRLADRLAAYCQPVAVEGLSFRRLKAEQRGW